MRLRRLLAQLGDDAGEGGRDLVTTHHEEGRGVAAAALVIRERITLLLGRPVPGQTLLGRLRRLGIGGLGRRLGRAVTLGLAVLG